MLTDPPAALAHAARDEKPVELKKLPPAVLASAEKMFPKAKWLQATRINDNGEVYYELAGALPGKKLLVVEIDDDGDISHIETEVDVKAVPKAVLAAFRKKYPVREGWKIDAVFEVEEADDDEDFEVIGYEFHAVWQKPKGKKGGKKPKETEVEVFVTVDGTIESDG